MCLKNGQIMLYRQKAVSEKVNGHKALQSAVNISQEKLKQSPGPVRKEEG